MSFCYLLFAFASRFLTPGGQDLELAGLGWPFGKRQGSYPLPPFSPRLPNWRMAGGMYLEPHPSKLLFFFFFLRSNKRSKALGLVSSWRTEGRGKADDFMAPPGSPSLLNPSAGWPLIMPTCLASKAQRQLD